ncbi:prolipoprotein diacylglyceryl transferase [Treponema parvum]|uniref:Phosphatidylglycerol--prolipoprotein diacylglyceryl transferase n=1 Tax=Treponema parvum TaxID=138851 RepID=A0A975F0T7_9SPIR|nr:prolipoprotein diacylglyceryl transferase [Treponema parvum]QTQ12491.1 prolipoprotein diacylglyceryl transferase [Treponema parvum]
MYLPLSITYPSWLHPEIFPGVPVLGLIRWYGLMYIVAFFVAYTLFKRLVKEGFLDTQEYKTSEEDVFSFFTTVILFLLIGARVFSTLVYDTSGLYWAKPWLIFWPFSENGNFTGLAGMSYHGGFIGALSGSVFWCVRKKKPVLRWADAAVCVIPAGYTFGRLGNFLNGELYGRITTMPWGVVFPHAQRFSKSLDWLQDFAQKAGIDLTAASNLVNLPRHPSQLYEAFFEGLVLWAVIWSLRKKKVFDGFLAAVYTFGYGAVRFVIEYFREPDADLGYRIIKESNAPIYLNTSLMNLSTGQILCLIMMAASLLFAAVRIIGTYGKRKSG